MSDGFRKLVESRTDKDGCYGDGEDYELCDALLDAADKIKSLRAEVERWAEVKSYWAKVVGRMHSIAQVRGLYEQTPRNLAALLDRALEGGE